MQRHKPSHPYATHKPSPGKKIEGGSWRKGKSANERGYTYKWQQYRLKFLFANPLCVYCEKKGKTEVATVVDHIEPHRGDMPLFWNPKNHQALCKFCHDSIKQQEEKMGL